MGVEQGNKETGNIVGLKELRIKKNKRGRDRKTKILLGLQQNLTESNFSPSPMNSGWSQNSEFI